MPFSSASRTEREGFKGNNGGVMEASAMSFATMLEGQLSSYHRRLIRYVAIHFEVYQCTSFLMNMSFRITGGLMAGYAVSRDQWRGACG